VGTGAETGPSRPVGPPDLLDLLDLETRFLPKGTY
jgi:hypothetical protein